MDDIPLLSNMDGEELFNTILSWATSLKNYMVAILTYMNELDTQKIKWASNPLSKQTIDSGIRPYLSKGENTM